jgi:hypothetical protein
VLARDTHDTHIYQYIRTKTTYLKSHDFLTTSYIPHTYIRPHLKTPKRWSLSSSPCLLIFNLHFLTVTTINNSISPRERKFRLQSKINRGWNSKGKKEEEQEMFALCSLSLASGRSLSSVSR